MYILLLLLILLLTHYFNSPKHPIVGPVKLYLVCVTVTKETWAVRKGQSCIKIELFSWPDVFSLFFWWKHKQKLTLTDTAQTETETENNRKRREEAKKGRKLTGSRREQRRGRWREGDKQDSRRNETRWLKETEGEEGRTGGSAPFVGT